MHCKHFKDCGGCDTQDIEYRKQLDLKEERIRILFADVAIGRRMPIVGSPEIWYYRNKMEFAINFRGETTVIGLRRKKSFYQVVDLEECRIFHKSVQTFFTVVKGWMERYNVKPYHIKQRSGTMRYLVLRHSKAYDQLMALIVISNTGDQTHPVENTFHQLAQALQRAGAVISVYLVSNNGLSDVAAGEGMRLIAGDEGIRENVLGVEYLIKPAAFFQTNPYCCAKLYGTIRSFAEGGAQSDALDLFCGSGGIALQVASSFRSVIGVDLSPQNIEDASRNAAMNGIKNVKFIAEDAERYMRSLEGGVGLGGISTVFVDPPRSGLTRKTKEIFAKSTIPKIVYVSCNPESLKADIVELSGAYHVDALVPIDMFPHTKHLEIVALLKRC